MICDRNREEFASPPNESEFTDDVKTKLWDPAINRGRWDYEVTACTITRNVNRGGPNPAPRV